MHAVVRNTMLADASVVSVLGQRVHWADAPPGESYPLAILQKVSGQRSVTLDGDDGLGRYLVQVDVYAAAHGDMRRAGDALRSLWSGYQSEEIPGAFIRGERETVEREDGADGLLYRVSIDIFLIVKEISDV